MKRDRKGFTGIELMIATAVVSALAAASFPAVRAAQISANQAGARETLSQLHDAAFRHLNFSGAFDFPTQFSQMSSYLPQVSTGEHNGYSYTYEKTASGFEVTAAPNQSGVTGNETYRITEGGEVSQVSNALPDTLDQMTNLGFRYTGIRHEWSEDQKSLSIIWSATFDKAFDSVILAMERMTLTGPAVSLAKVLADGTIRKSKKDSTEVAYLNLGAVKAGQVIEAKETVQNWNGEKGKNNVNAYSRSLSFRGYNKP